MSRAREAANWIGTGVTSAELNKLDGFTGTVDDLNYAKDLRATGVTATEFDKLDGFTGTVDDLNYAKDLRATGVTSTEFDKLDGFTGDADDLNYAKDLRTTGVTDAEFDQLDTTSGTPGATNYLRGDKTWATISNLGWNHIETIHITSNTSPINFNGAVSSDYLMYRAQVYLYPDAAAGMQMRLLTGTDTQNTDSDHYCYTRCLRQSDSLDQVYDNEGARSYWHINQSASNTHLGFHGTFTFFSVFGSSVPTVDGNAIDTSVTGYNLPKGHFIGGSVQHGTSDVQLIGSFKKGTAVNATGFSFFMNGQDFQDGSWISLEGFKAPTT